MGWAEEAAQYQSIASTPRKGAVTPRIHQILRRSWQTLDHPGPSGLQEERRQQTPSPSPCVLCFASSCFSPKLWEIGVFLGGKQRSEPWGVRGWGPRSTGTEGISPFHLRFFLLEHSHSHILEEAACIHSPPCLPCLPPSLHSAPVRLTLISPLFLSITYPLLSHTQDLIWF